MININNTIWMDLTAEDVEDSIVNEIIEESFFFEFKDDRVSPAKLAEEITALANTYGGYIIIGVSDDKVIEGCEEWNEIRIQTTIHDSISPIPLFDVKRFRIKEKTIYIIRIEEGPEPPYITNKGKILERVSSGSHQIKDSSRLAHLYAKGRENLDRIKTMISIKPASTRVSNIYGYIDIGFYFAAADKEVVINKSLDANIDEIPRSDFLHKKGPNLTRIGSSIFYTPGVLSSPQGVMPAHSNNFLEVMVDGSARMRVILSNNDDKDSSVNMIYANTFLTQYRNIYNAIFGDIIAQQFIYAKKYEQLTALKQFNQTFYYDADMIAAHPDWEEEGIRLIANKKKNQAKRGNDVVVTDDRIPKIGLMTIDNLKLKEWGLEGDNDSILEAMFHSNYVSMGYPDEQ